MVFSSAVFLFIFFPIVFLLYIAVPNMRFRNILLVIASLVFYAFGEPVYILLMLGSIAINYVFGILVSRTDRCAKIALIAAIIVNVGILVVFKYADFLVANINTIFSLSVSLPGMHLPLGISFFTFQTISYVVDTYRSKQCQRNVGKLALYVSFFPRIVSGPIVKYSDAMRELDERHTSTEDIAEGLRCFIFGFAKKVLVANTVGIAVDAIFKAGGGSAPVAWLGAILYTVQLYFDFSGYSDMAVGLGRVFGFHFTQNFDYPLAASSVQDFWRRWHISLSLWFREYVYIPLGGNRKGKARTALNRLIVFFLTGLWHGASWNFVLWGLIHGVSLVIEGLFKRKDRHNGVFGHIYTLFIVVLAFVLFRADNISSGFSYIATMFTGFNFSPQLMRELFALATPWLISMAALGIIFAMPVRNAVYRRLDARRPALVNISYIAALGLLVLCVFSMASTTFSPFIYFRF